MDSASWNPLTLDAQMRGLYLLFTEYVDAEKSPCVMNRPSSWISDNPKCVK